MTKITPFESKNSIFRTRKNTKFSCVQHVFKIESAVNSLEIQTKFHGFLFMSHTTGQRTSTFEFCSVESTIPFEDQVTYILLKFSVWIFSVAPKNEDCNK